MILWPSLHTLILPLYIFFGKSFVHFFYPLLICHLFVFADCKSFSIFGCKEYNQSDFWIDHLVMSMCRVISSVVGRGCLLRPVCSLGLCVLLAFALLHFILHGQTCLLLQVSLDFLLSNSNPLWWKEHILLVLVLEGIVGLHRTVQRQLNQD